MPVYEYICNQCKKPYQIRASVEEKQRGLRLKCPNCGSQRATQAFSGVSFGPTGSVQKRSGDSGCCEGKGCC